MTVAQFEAFQRLRAARKIGRVWPEGNGYLMAPIDPESGLSLHQAAEYIDSHSFDVLLAKLAGTPPPPPLHRQTIYSPAMLAAWGSRHRQEART